MNLQCEEPAFMLQPAFLKGISLLEKYGFTYDLVILPKHLGAALRLVQMFPAQRFVINHLAKPCIKDKKTDGWKQGIEALANHPNVYCKISGMVTEADWENWSVEDLKPYLDIVTGCFGISRLMYGGDWPVCLLATSYYRWLNTVVHYFNDLTAVDKEKFFSKNAIGFYNL